MHRKGTFRLLVPVLAALVAGGACGSTSSTRKSGSEPTCIKPENGTGCLPVAPSSERIDLARPTFSDPRRITNPLHSNANLDQVIYGGLVDGKPFRTEFTRLDDVKMITWDGQRIPAVTWQYLAYSDGRILEVALDWFAQADDGSVWYLGEDVFNYEDGAVADTRGTWIAGDDAPAAMIMPSKPAVGAVYRPENSPGVVFEEVTIKKVGVTMQGPRGLVRGAIVADELHADGTHEDKIFAPGYGEFSSGDPSAEHETVSLAVPIDARPGPMPAPVSALSSAVRTAFDATAARNWAVAIDAAGAVTKAWSDVRAHGVPPILERQVDADLVALERAIGANGVAAAQGAALRVAQDDLDLQLLYRPLAEIETARHDLWQRQLAVDTARGDRGAIAGDKETLRWISSRLKTTATN